MKTPVDSHRPGGLRRWRRWFALAALLLVAAAGCRSTRDKSATPVKTSEPKWSRTVRGVICLFDQKPWINADAAGDRDPEGIRYRVYLDDGFSRGIHQKGTFHIEMYQITRDENGEQKRVLVSDWHYPSSAFVPVKAKVLGAGYLIQLRWAKKCIAGTEIEIVTQFEDSEGGVTRGATKRLRVPKYTSS